MKLSKRRSFNDEYVCELTEALDAVSEYKNNENDIFRAYLYDVRDSYTKNLFAIRVPGRTIGDLEVDSNMCIVSAVIGDDCFYLFTTNPNDVLKKFIGQKLELVNDQCLKCHNYIQNNDVCKGLLEECDEYKEMED